MASASPLFPSSGISDRAAKVGFRFGAKGTHTSRTMMFDELAAVLAAAPETASREDYAAAIVEGAWQSPMRASEVMPAASSASALSDNSR